MSTALFPQPVVPEPVPQPTSPVMKLLAVSVADSSSPGPIMGGSAAATVPLRGKTALVSSSSLPSSSVKETFTFTCLPASAATSS